MTELAATLAAQPADPTSPGGYSLVAVHVWSHTVADVVEVVSKLAALGANVEVVAPSKLVQRVASNVRHSRGR